VVLLEQRDAERWMRRLITAGYNTEFDDLEAIRTCMVERSYIVNGGQIEIRAPTSHGMFLVQAKGDLPVLDEREAPGIFKLSVETNNCPEILEDRLDEIEPIIANFVEAGHGGIIDSEHGPARRVSRTELAHGTSRAPRRPVPAPRRRGGA
jgi:hypothetical protein